MKITFLFILMAAYFTVSTIAQDHDYSFMEEYKLASDGHFGLSTSDGFIYVYPSEDDLVKVYYIIRKDNKLLKVTRDELPENIELEIVSEQDKLDILVKQSNSHGWTNWRNSYSVSCEVYVPVTTSCFLKSSDGDVKLRGLQGKQKCKTSDGDVVVLDVKGDLIAETSDGDITVENINGALSLQSSDGDLVAKSVNGDARFATSDGDIELYMVSGVLEASTSDGDISFTDCAGSFSAVTSDGDARGNMIKLKGKLSVVTSDGDIEVGIPQGTGFDLKMKGEDLDIPRMELKGRLDEHYIQGSVNGGGVPVELITSDGYVKLFLK